MKQRPPVNPGVCCMLKFGGWALVLSSMFLLLFGISLFKLLLVFISACLLTLFYRLSAKSSE